jgi:hypothetical protein
MAMGSYDKNATVRIPFQITDGGVPITDTIPVVEKIILPSGAQESGFPQSMTAVDMSMGTYEYQYKARSTGDYIVIISVDIDDETYVSLENFTVKTTSSSNPPRAESR